MGSYIVSSKEEQQKMAEAIGLKSAEDLLSQIPEKVKYCGEWEFSKGLSEMETSCKIRQMASRNQVFSHIFRGAGAYNHYIPAIVDSVSSKEEFVTAYTPYQPEISQGILQSIFEYQTMICELTGMDVSNASVYDGATAAAEAAAMCLEKRRTKIVISACADPKVIQVIRTYAYGNKAEVVLVPERDGRTDLEELEKVMDQTVACVYLQEPNYYGLLEDCERAGKLAKEAGAKYILGCNPISLAVLKTPGEYGADIAVGEGQPLGLELGFGGPYLGFMAVQQKMMRKLPGRIVGETTDKEGKRAYVLTLQAREQHIRREKASSNICSNQAWCALRASVYMAAMGAKGMELAARHCSANAHYLCEQLEEIGFKRKHKGTFFHEFVTRSPIDSKIILEALEKHGYLGGLPLSEQDILWCATEKNTKEEMDEMARILKEVCGA